MLERVWKEGNPPTLLVGMHKNKASIWPCSPIPEHVSGEKRDP